MFCHVIPFAIVFIIPEETIDDNPAEVLCYIKLMATTRHAGLTHQQFVTRTGYVLFALIVLGIIISTVIPMTSLLLSPTAKQLNVLILLVSLVAGGLLPILIAYIIGDKETWSKDRSVHHYNGVAFGILGYWLSLIVSVISPASVASVRAAISSLALSELVNAWPILATTLVILAIAIPYHRHHVRKGVVTGYGPYQWALWLSVGVMVVGVPAVQFINHTDFDPYSLLSFAVVFAPLVISYLCLHRLKRTVAERVTLAILGASLALITLYASIQLLPLSTYIDDPLSTISSCVSFALGLAVLIAYLRVTIRERK